MNCSARTGPMGVRVRPPAAGGALPIAVLTLAVVIIAVALIAPDEILGQVTGETGGEAMGETLAEISDAAARMQYAFYTGDARTLEEVLELLEGLDVNARLAALKSYQLAYGRWKLAELYADPGTGQGLQSRRGANSPAARSPDAKSPNTKSLASKAARQCVRDARAAIDADGAMGEAYAIEAVCDGFSPGERGVRGVAECSDSKSLRTALSLAPDNPRVRLIEALCAGAEGSDPAALGRWRAAVEAFEAAPPAAPGAPDWGHIEALTRLGEAYLRLGDTVAARDALERALILSPDYAAARRLLQQATARPR